MATIFSDVYFAFGDLDVGGSKCTLSDTGVLTITPMNGYDNNRCKGAVPCDLTVGFTGMSESIINAVKTITFDSGTYFFADNTSGNYVAQINFNPFKNLETVTAFPGYVGVYAGYTGSGGNDRRLYFNNAFNGCSKLRSIASFASVYSDYVLVGCRYMFRGCTSLTSVNLSNLKFENTAADGMFHSCSALTTITFSTSRTSFSGTPDFSYMFYDCRKLATITGIGYLRTASATSMKSMFENCTSLTFFPLSNFNTALVTDASRMFAGCTSTTSITFGSACTFVSNKNFNKMFSGCTSLVTISGLQYMRTVAATNLSYMFEECVSLTTAIPFSNAITASATTADGMFYNCKKVPSITFGSGSTFVNCLSMWRMFYGCESLTSITGLSNMVASNCTTTMGMFRGCSSLTSLTFGSSFGGYNIENMSYMFHGCKALTTITNLSAFSTYNVTDMSYMFYECNALTAIDVSGFSTPKVTTMRAMFNRCYAVTSLDLSSATSEVLTDLRYTFVDCTSLEEITFGSGFTCSEVWFMTQMFAGCVALEELDLSYFAPAKASLMNDMFKNCKELTDTGISSSFNTGSATSMQGMFYNCNKLTYVDLSGFDTSSVISMHAMFYNCEVIDGIDVSGFDTSNVANMSYMFYGANSITALDVSDFNTSRVTSFSHMFAGVKSSVLDVSTFNTQVATNMHSMFENCAYLTSLDLRSFVTTNVTDMQDMFAKTTSLETVKIGTSFSTDALETSESKQLGFAPATNTDTTTAVISDLDFVNLATVDKEGEWDRDIVNAFDATAFRSAGGFPEDTGNDVTFHIRWITSAITADRTLTIYKRLTSASTFPAEPEMTLELEGSAGEQNVTLEDAGSEAYTFRLEFYDGTTTYYSFPQVNSTARVIIISPDGDVLLRFDTGATSGTDDYDINATLTMLGWDSEVIVD